MRNTAFFLLAAFMLAAPVLAQVCIPPPSGLTNWWPGDGDARDFQGSSNGSPSGGVAFVAGQGRQFFSFDGASGLVDFGNAVGNFGTADFTISFWVRTKGSTLQSVMGKRPICDHASYIDIRMGGGGPGRLGFEIDQDTSGTNYNIVNAATSVNDGDWHSITLTRAGSTASIFVDGKRDAMGTTAGATEILNGSSWITGQSTCTGLDGTSNFLGDLDEILVFNRALSLAEIQAIYNAGSSGICKAGSADVSVTKSGPISSEFFSVANEITYKIVVSNNSRDADAAGVTVTDPAPPGLTFVSASGDCTTLPCTIGALRATASTSFQATYKLRPGLAGLIVNAATVSSVNDPNSANNTATARTYICPISAPSGPLPKDNARGVPADDFILSWSNEGAATYTVFLDVAGLGCRKVVPHASTPGTILFVRGLRPGSSYEWRVEAASPGCRTKPSACFSFTTGAPRLDIKQTRDPAAGLPVFLREPGMGLVPHENKWFRVTYTLTITNVGDGDTQGPINVSSILGPRTNIATGVFLMFRPAPGFACTQDFLLRDCTTNEVLKGKRDDSPGDSRTLQVDLEGEAINLKQKIEHFGLVTGGGAPRAVSESDELKIPLVEAQKRKNPAPTTGRERPK